MMMVPFESSPLLGVFGGGGGEVMMMRETTTNNQDHSSDEGEACSLPLSTNYYNIFTSPVTTTTNKDDRSTAKNDVACYRINNVEGSDKSWLRLGIGPEENNNNTASYNKLQRFGSENATCGREKSLELSLSTAAEAFRTSFDQPLQQQQPPFSHHQHDQHMTMVYNNNQFIRPHQTLLNRGFSLKPQHTAPFRPYYNNSVTKSCCVDEEGAGPSSEFRVIDPPRRPHSGLWFLLQASQFQEKEPFLPQVSKSYLRIKDGRITVRLLIKYLTKKLQLDSESKVEIRCRGQQLSPLLTMQHVRDNIWTPKSSSSSPTFTLLRDSSTSDHVMILHYGRIA